MVYEFAFGLTVYFDTPVENQLRSFMQLAGFSLESGGILIGRIKPLSHSIIVTDMTYPQQCDKRAANRFSRKQSGHQKIMDDLWEASGYEKMYLGEWHTHNTPIPAPSKLDIREWKKATSRHHNTPFVLFLIVGKREARLWTINAEELQVAKEVQR